MTTVKKTQRGKAGANNVLPGDLRPLYPVPVASRSGMSPLLCVGQDLSVDCGSHTVSVSGIFVTPAGSVLFVLEEPYSAVIVHRFISEVSSWASDDPGLHLFRPHPPGERPGISHHRPDGCPGVSLLL